MYVYIYIDAYTIMLQLALLLQHSIFRFRDGGEGRSGREIRRSRRAAPSRANSWPWKARKRARSSNAGGWRYIFRRFRNRIQGWFPMPKYRNIKRQRQRRSLEYIFKPSDGDNFYWWIFNLVVIWCFFSKSSSNRNLANMLYCFLLPFHAPTEAQTLLGVWSLGCWLACGRGAQVVWWNLKMTLLRENLITLVKTWYLIRVSKYDSSK